MKFSNGGIIFWVVVLVLFFAMVGLLAWDYYKKAEGQKKVEELANELKRLQQELTDRKSADKIGGATPQETFDLFISAVEKGDYDLASKYFVIEEQEEVKTELMSLKEKDNLSQYLDILHNAKPDGDIKDDHFRMVSKLEVGPPDYFLDFIKYPAGNWKIEKI